MTASSQDTQTLTSFSTPLPRLQHYHQDGLDQLPPLASCFVYSDKYKQTKNMEIPNSAPEAQEIPNSAPEALLTTYLKIEQNEFGTWKSILSANKLY